MGRMKISFDFDGTLEMREVQEMAQEMIDRGHDVCILTTRYSDPSSYRAWKYEDNRAALRGLHNELLEVARNLGITEIHFTEWEWKTTVIDNYNIDIHIDDNFRDEVAVINHNNKAKAIFYDYGSSSWKRELYNLLGIQDELQIRSTRSE